MLSSFFSDELGELEELINASESFDTSPAVSGSGLGLSGQTQGMGSGRGPSLASEQLAIDGIKRQLMGVDPMGDSGMDTGVSSGRSSLQVSWS